MRRLLYYLVLVYLCAGLAACAPIHKNVFPPTVTVQQMYLRQDGQWQLTLRIQNNSYRRMDFQAIDASFAINHDLPVRLSKRFERHIPAFAADVIDLIILPTPAMSRALVTLTQQGSAGTLAYHLHGVSMARAAQEKQPRRFVFHTDDWLSPVPGMVNTYR